MRSAFSAYLNELCVEYLGSQVYAENAEVEFKTLRESKDTFAVIVVVPLRLCGNFPNYHANTSTP